MFHKLIASKRPILNFMMY